MRPMGGCGGRSGFRDERCQEGMSSAFLAITILTALLNGYAAVLNFAGADSVKAVADRVQIARRWMVPLGVLLALGALGLLLGLAVPLLGTLAAIGLVVYFVSALAVHLRAGDSQIAGAVFFLIMAVAALLVSAAYRDPWAVVA